MKLLKHIGKGKEQSRSKEWIKLCTIITLHLTATANHTNTTDVLWL